MWSVGSPSGIKQAGSGITVLGSGITSQGIRIRRSSEESEIGLGHFCRIRDQNLWCFYITKFEYKIESMFTEYTLLRSILKIMANWMPFRQLFHLAMKQITFSVVDAPGKYHILVIWTVSCRFWIPACKIEYQLFLSCLSLFEINRNSLWSTIHSISRTYMSIPSIFLVHLWSKLVLHKWDFLSWLVTYAHLQSQMISVLCTTESEGAMIWYRVMASYTWALITKKISGSCWSVCLSDFVLISTMKPEIVLVTSIVCLNLLF